MLKNVSLTNKTGCIGEQGINFMGEERGEGEGSIVRWQKYVTASSQLYTKWWCVLVKQATLNTIEKKKEE